VTNFPGTQVVGGTVQTWNPFVLPRPDLSENYNDYLDRLRADGWVGSAIIDGVESGTGLGSYGPNSITRIHLAALGVDQDPASWPLVPPVMSSNTLDVHIRINPGTAPPLPSSGACSCPPLSLTPLTTIDYGSRFPFGLPSWFAAAYTGIGSTPFTLDQTVSGHTFNETLGGTEWETTYRPRVFLIAEFCLTILAIVAVGKWGIGIGNNDNGDE
jgi:hypothetical protein